MIHLPLNISIKNALIPLPPSPVHDVLTSELMIDLDDFLGLSAGVSEGGCVGVGRASVHVTRVREEILSSP